jgi:hypothetical protein
VSNALFREKIKTSVWLQCLGTTWKRQLYALSLAQNHSLRSKLITLQMSNCVAGNLVHIWMSSPGK